MKIEGIDNDTIDRVEQNKMSFKNYHYLTSEVLNHPQRYLVKKRIDTALAPIKTLWEERIMALKLKEGEAVRFCCYKHYNKPFNNINLKVAEAEANAAMIAAQLATKQAIAEAERAVKAAAEAEWMKIKEADEAKRLAMVDALAERNIILEERKRDEDEQKRIEE